MNIPPDLPPGDLPPVLITCALPPGWVTSLHNWCRPIIAPPDTPGWTPALRQHLPDTEGLLVLLTDRVNEDLLAESPRLRVVSNMAVGVDNIDLAACTRRGIPVGNTPGVLTDATADLGMALLLATARNLPTASLDAREGRWRTWSPTGWLGADLHKATLGILGLGKIGQAIAKRARGFGMRLLFTNRTSKPAAATELGATQVPLRVLIKQSDFLVITVALNRETRGMIDQSVLRGMKPNAILINISRGPVINTPDLVRALQEGWISAAALDVTDPEPLPPGHPLYSLPNCLITPHIGSASYRTRRRMAELACENLIAGLEGRQLPHCVNPEVYHHPDQ